MMAKPDWKAKAVALQTKHSVTTPKDDADILSRGEEGQHWFSGLPPWGMWGSKGKDFLPFLLEDVM